MTTNSNRFSLGARSTFPPCGRLTARSVLRRVRTPERCHNFFRRRAHLPHATAFGDDDGAKPIDGARHLVVDDDVIVDGVLTHFAPRYFEPRRDLLLAVLASPPQPLPEN